MRRPVVAIYRDELLRPTETFIRSQGSALTRYEPVYVGSVRVPGLDLAPARVVTLDGGGPAGYGAQVLYKLTGVAPGLARRIAALNPALIHAHYGPDAALVLPIARTLRIPLVVTFHGYDATIADAFARRSFYRHRAYVRRRGRLMAESELFVAVSRFIARRLVEQGFSADRVRTHYIGVDVAGFRADPGVAREPIVLFVGRLVEKKGCELLIRAFRAIGETLPQAELVVIGDGPLRARLEGLASGLGVRARFLGTQPPSIVRHWMNRARVFSVPSVTAASGDAEGLGIVFLEAQAMGLPVVSCASGGVPEAVAEGETGFLVPEHDHSALAAAIVRLFQFPDLWSRFSDAGRARVEQRFDVRAQTRQLELIYDEAWKNGGATAGRADEQAGARMARATSR
jgi:glycosyltransferase involved in cell wall biosynthesis